MNRLAVILLLWIIVFPIHAQSAADLLKAGARMRGVVVPLYNKADHSYSIIIRIDRVYTGMERKGFFRIGVLPVGVLEGVTVELQQTNRLTNCLDRLNYWLTPQTASRLELRHARIECSPTNRLEAGLMQIDKHGIWNLLEGVTLVQGDITVQGPQARFYTTGDRAGEVVMATSTNRFFFGGSAQAAHSPSKDRKQESADNLP